MKNFPSCIFPSEINIIDKYDKTNISFSLKYKQFLKCIFDFSISSLSMNNNPKILKIENK
jgi:hypothetical protein